MDTKIKELTDEIARLNQLVQIAAAAEQLAKVPEFAIRITVFGPNDTQVTHMVENNERFANALMYDRWDIEKLITEAQAKLTKVESEPITPETTPSVEPERKTGEAPDFDFREPAQPTTPVTHDDLPF
jgi:hypothetical protein